MSQMKPKEGIKSKRLYFLGVLPLLSSILATEPVQAVSLSLLPALQSVSVGDGVAVEVQISDLGNFQSPSLSGFDLEVSFEPSVLMFDNIAFGDPTLGDLVNLAHTPGLTSVIPGLGTVNFAEVSLDSPAALNAAQPSSFILARLNFIALTARQNSLINLSVIDLADEDTNPLMLSGIPQGAAVMVSANSVKTPEPNCSLVGLGLTLGLGLCLKRKAFC
jgi:hypothetical protein